MKKCKIKGCKREYRARGYCATHYAQFMKYGKIPIRTVEKRLDAESKYFGEVIVR